MTRWAILVVVLCAARSQKLRQESHVLDPQAVATSQIPTNIHATMRPDMLLPSDPVEQPENLAYDTTPPTDATGTSEDTPDIEEFVQDVINGAYRKALPVVTQLGFDPAISGDCSQSMLKLALAFRRLEPWAIRSKCYFTSKNN